MFSASCQVAFPFTASEEASYPSLHLDDWALLARIEPSISGHDGLVCYLYSSFRLLVLQFSHTLRPLLEKAAPPLLITNVYKKRNATSTQNSWSTVARNNTKKWMEIHLVQIFLKDKWSQIPRGKKKESERETDLLKLWRLDGVPQLFLSFWQGLPLGQEWDEPLLDLRIGQYRDHSFRIKGLHQVHS